MLTLCEECHVLCNGVVCDIAVTCSKQRDEDIEQDDDSQDGPGLQASNSALHNR